MKRKIVTTKDGSKTIRIEDWDEHYHSIHGAIQEAMHVYIQAGLEHYMRVNPEDSITVLEAGFGTGLNALLTGLWAEKNSITLDYIGLEAYPISKKEIEALDYPKVLQEKESPSIYDRIHQASWEEWVDISKGVRLQKQQLFFSDLNLNHEADVVFYDAFGPRVQPELWEAPVFERFYNALKPGGILVTYSVKGTAKRALQAIGFEVDIIEGPPGKRHMMRAYKS